MRLPPDAYALGTLALVLIGEWLAPLSWLPAPGLLSPLGWLGVLMAVAGFTLEAAAGRALAQAATPTRPFALPTSLVTTGPFAWSRNPLYVGMLVLITGIALALSLEWGLLLVPVLWACLDRLVIPHEESALRGVFGTAFEVYRTTIPRWL